MTEMFLRRDTGTLYELISEDQDQVELRAYDQDHNVSSISREDLAKHFDATNLALTISGVASDGAGGVRLYLGEQLVHLTPEHVALIASASAPPA